MSGDTKRRFCEHCQLHVHNLSAMSQRERDRFITESAGQSCIAYQLRPDGTMVTLSLWRGAFRPIRQMQFAFVAILATLLPFFFSACASRRTLGRDDPSGHTLPHGDHAEDNCAVTLGVPIPPETSPTKNPK